MDEARSLAAMLRESIELGTEVRDALRAFSDDMRDRRVLRAEEPPAQNGRPARPVHISSYSRHCDVAGLTYGAKITQTATSRPIAEFCAGKGG